jgi:hypothetical protein
MGLQFCNELVGTESCRRGIAEHVSHQRAQAAVVFVRGAGLGWGRAHKRADAATGLEHSGSFELAVDARDGVGVDSKIDGELADGGKLIPEAQPAGRNGGSQPALELCVDGRPVTRIELNDSH